MIADPTNEPLIIRVRAVDLFDVTSDWGDTEPFFFVADRPAKPVMLRLVGKHTVTVSVGP